MQELRLIFAPLAGGDSFTVTLEDTPGHAIGTPVPFKPFLDDADYENLRWYLEDFMDLPDGGAIKRAQGVEEQLRTWGRQLHEAVFTAPENAAVLRQLLAAPEPRELTIATDVPELLRLPWELMADAAGNLAQRVSVRRQLEKPEKLIARPVTLPLRMLYIISRPGDTGFIDPRLTTRALFDALDSLEGHVRLDFCRPPTVARMEELLREAQAAGDPYDLVHFDGHGTFLPEAQIGALCFEKADDGSGDSTTDFVRADRLARVLAGHGVGIVVLEACRSSCIGKTTAFRSIAPSLIQAGVGTVLSMSHAIHVEAARILFKRFYEEFLNGTTIGSAVQSGRRAMRDYQRRWLEFYPHGSSIVLQDWLIPQLYQSCQTELCHTSSIPSTYEFDAFLSHRHVNANRVETIASILRDDFGLKIWFDTWECIPGPLHDQCVHGVAKSRFVLIAVSKDALESKWVAAEHNWARAGDPQGWRVIPILLEPVALPPDLEVLLRFDYCNPAADFENSAHLASKLKRSPRIHRERDSCEKDSGTHSNEAKPNKRFVVVVSGEADETSVDTAKAMVNHLSARLSNVVLTFEEIRSGSVRLVIGSDQTSAMIVRDAVNSGEVNDLLGRPITGLDMEPLLDESVARTEKIDTLHVRTASFPPRPKYGFQGRARELLWLERTLQKYRGVVLHAMGGMGKTALASEAARWWVRSGLYRDGACFVSFERTLMTAERVVAILGDYCEGPHFHQLPATEQRRRAIEFLRDRAVLMVWDNFESALPSFHQDSPYTDEHRAELASLFADLTSGAGRGGVLVTCRPGDTGLPGARKFELHGLARADSLWLLQHILEREGISLADRNLTRKALDPLVRDLADHPLSLELVGPHLRKLSPEDIRADLAAIVAKAAQDSDQQRNTTLFHSLEFSRRHLSPTAREALSWLGLFSGGVFEDNLLDVSQLTPEAWSPIRQELEGIALLRAEDDIQIGGRPFLRFHPTLALASADAARVADPEIRERYIHVYLALMQALDKALSGSQSRAALAILDREEMNYRTAVRWAIATGQLQFAAALGNTFRDYLERSGRLRERDAWVQMLHAAVGAGGFTEEAATMERQHAWTLFTQGDPQGAVNRLQALIQRLRHTTEFEPAFQLAHSLGLLGRLLLHAGACNQAVSVLCEAIGNWEAIVDSLHNETFETQALPVIGFAEDSSVYAVAASPMRPGVVTMPFEYGAVQIGDDNLGETSSQKEVSIVSLTKGNQSNSRDTAQRNLASCLADLSSALAEVGQLEESLTIAERSLGIVSQLRLDRDCAAGFANLASILVRMGRYDEADARYEQALAAAVAAGDRELEGATLQHQGGLADDRNQLDRATHLYQQALQRFQEADAKGHMMRTYNLLGVIEQKAGRLAGARAWYEKSRALAVGLKDQPSLAAAAQNLGIVSQLEGEGARARGDEAAARLHFDAARRSVEESLHIRQGLGNKPDEAAALGQLARIHLLLGDLDTAEHHAHAAREIHESIGLKEAFRDYNTLSEIAAARGDTTAAAAWARKRDALRAELKQRAGGGGIPGQMFKALTALAIACARAGFGDDPLGPAEEEALAKLDSFDAPFPAFSTHLRHFAAGQTPPIPAGLPKELEQLLTQLTAAIRDSGS